MGNFGTGSKCLSNKQNILEAYINAREQVRGEERVRHAVQACQVGQVRLLFDMLGEREPELRYGKESTASTSERGHEQGGRRESLQCTYAGYILILPLMFVYTTCNGVHEYKPVFAFEPGFHIAAEQRVICW